MRRRELSSIAAGLAPVISWPRTLAAGGQSYRMAVGRKKSMVPRETSIIQRMGLSACIRSLEQVKANDIPIDVYSDSAYLVNCMRDSATSIKTGLQKLDGSETTVIAGTRIPLSIRLS